jgi:hypothetical protein
MWGRVLACAAALACAAVPAACSGTAHPGGAGAPATAPPTAAPTTTAPTSTPAVAPPSTTTTGATVNAGPCGTAAHPPPVYRHVVWIWMENHAYGAVIGSPHAPYLTQLARDCATATRYSTVGSPSLPNYLGATGGSTFGVRDDAGPALHPVASDNLFRQVRDSGASERSYEESMPTNCATSSSGRYAVKHNPAAYYVGGDDRAACRADDVPLPQLASDLSAGALPAFSFVTPNLCDDTHDCSVATGDAWLRSWVPRLLDSAEYRAGATAVVILYDEYTPVPNVFIAPSARVGTVVATPINHYALLRATEEMLGLPALLAGAATAPDLRPLLGV